MMKKRVKRLLAGGLALCMTAGLVACGKDSNKEKGGDASLGVKNLMEGVTAQAATPDNKIAEESLAAITDFSVRLLQNCVTEDAKENTILSPLSVLYALAMTENGAEGDTLQQMEEVFGLSRDEMNQALQNYKKLLPSGEKYQVTMANSIWFTEEESRKFVANKEFLQKNADCYDAEIYQALFDNATKDAINLWVEDATDGQIENILAKIDPNAIMYLVNAISFDAEWQEIYQEYQVREREFTGASGKKQTIDFMHSKEFAYLEDENAVGMMKYYSGRRYAFVALLPNEAMTVEEYVNSLDGAALRKLLDDKQNVEVNVLLPKFTCEADYSMRDILIRMGMKDAFDDILANFDGMGTVPDGYNIMINEVIHKAKIEVNEKGTKAGAATVVEMATGAAMPMEKPKEVILDRPFVYMLLDTARNVPIFVGTVMELQ
ncbi:MAG: serpin family protein [Lachnospiraceae bacterium]|nr:serpin family protein [Lachnospiraceae bacterium]